MKAELWHRTAKHQRAPVELTSASRTPQQICLRWIPLQAIGRHPLTNGLTG